MPSAKLLGAVAAGALFVAAQAHAATVYRSEAKLAAPAAQATATISGAAWRCDGDACVGERSHSTLDSPMRECRKVAAQFGALAAFTSEGQKFDAGDLKACNLAAKDGGTSTGGK